MTFAETFFGKIRRYCSINPRGSRSVVGTIEFLASGRSATAVWTVPLPIFAVVEDSCCSHIPTGTTAADKIALHHLTMGTMATLRDHQN